MRTVPPLCCRYGRAMAIAERQDGAELSIGYADAGTYPLSAVWLAGLT